MELKFYIIGGFIKIKKQAFNQEMLSKDSYLRQILEWRDTRECAEKYPAVGEPDENGIITIDFNYTVHVELRQSAMDILSTLKERHGDRIKGRICCRWLAGYSMSNFVIDLDSSDNKIKQEQ